MTRKIKFVVNAARWFDRVNGNTYHSVNVTRCRDGQVISGGMEYGYGECYKQTALGIMAVNKWLPVKYRSSKMRCYFERANNYPIQWNVTDGLKRDCIANGKG